MAGMRRFFIGVASGAVVAALGLGLVSQISAPGAAPAVEGTQAGPKVTAGTPAAPPKVVAAEPAAPLPGTASDAVPAPVPGDPADADPAYGVSGAGMQTLDATRDDPAATAAAGTDSALLGEVPAVAEAAPDIVAEAEGPVVDAPEVVAAPDVAAQDGGAVPPSGAAPDVAAAAPKVVAGTEAPVADAPEGVAAPAAPDVAKAAPVDATAVPAPGATANIAGPPATPLTDAPHLRPAPDVSGTAGAPAADTTAALAQQGPAAPRAPAVGTAPPTVDLPPPPPLTPEEQAVAADAPPVVAEETPEVAAAPVAVPVPAPVPEEPEVAAGPAEEPVVPTVIEVDAVPSVLQPDTPLIEATPELPATPSLAEAGEGVIVNRPASATDAAPLPEVALEDAPADAPFAAAFDNPDAKPLFSIVLVDGGDASVDRAAIAALPFAVSVAIDPLAPDAGAHAELYRAGGKEVLMLASGIPAGATPADLEQTFQALATALPQAVAVVDTEEGRFQNDRPLAAQIVPILAAQGRGLVTWDRGLNAADQEARREGLASALIFRRIDGEGAGIPVIRRYLDRAAFKAGQDGRVTVMGEARAETVAALVEWAVEGRASAVALAPISAQLTGR
jgi:uncharacterized protein